VTAFDAGAIESRLILDKSQFTRELAAARAEGAKGVEVPLNFDSGKLAGSLAAAKAAMQRAGISDFFDFSMPPAKIAAQLQAYRRLIKQSGISDALGAQTIPVRVVADTSGLGGLGKLGSLPALGETVQVRGLQQAREQFAALGIAANSLDAALARGQADFAALGISANALAPALLPNLRYFGQLTIGARALQLATSTLSPALQQARENFAALGISADALANRGLAMTATAADNATAAADRTAAAISAVAAMSGISEKKLAALAAQADKNGLSLAELGTQTARGARLFQSYGQSLDPAGRAVVGLGIAAGVSEKQIAKFAAAGADTSSRFSAFTGPLNTLAFGWGRAAGGVQLYGGALTKLGVPAMIATMGAVHVLTQSIFELGATLIPAGIAFGAFGAAAVPAIQAITQQMHNLHTVATALNVQMPGLSGGFTKAADAVKPQVYQLFGDMLQIASKKSGEFVTIAKGAGTVLDQLGARFTVAITNGKGFSQFLGNAVHDLAGWGTFIGNLGGIIGNLLKTMPGYAQTVLGVLDGVTHALEVFTGQGWVQGILGSFLSFHGAFIYAGLGATVMSAAMQKSLPFIGGLVEKAGFAAGRMGLLARSGEEGATALSRFGGAISGAAGLPWGWIAAAAIGVGFLTYKLITMKDSTQQWLDTLQKGLSTDRLGNAISAAQGLSLIQQDQILVAQHLAVAQTQLGGVTRKYGGQADYAAGRVTAANVQLGAAAGKVQELTAGQKQLNDQSALYNSRLARLAVAAGGTGAAMGIMTAAGITMKQMLDWSKWPEIVAQVEATTAAYREMGQTGGVLGADMNAMNIAASSQVAAMQKLNGAWDSVIGIVSGGQSAFVTFQQDLLSVAEAYKQVGGVKRVVTDTFGGAAAAVAAASKTSGASLNGLNAASLQLRATWQTAFGGGQKLIDALRMMQSASPGGFPSVTQAIKDILLEMTPLGRTTGATRAELVTLAQEVNPAITNFKELTKWLGNVKDPAKQLNGILAAAGINLQNLATDAANLTANLQNNLINTFNMAKIASSHAGAAMTQLAKDITTPGTSAAQIHGDMQTLYQDYRRAGLSASDANTLISTMTGQIFHGAEVTKATHPARATLAGDIQAITSKAPGASGDMQNLATAIQQHGEKSDAYRNARARLIGDLITSGVSARNAQGLVDNLQTAIDNMHGKSVQVTLVGAATGILKATGQGVSSVLHFLSGFAGGGKITQGTGPTADDVLIRASKDETVVSAQHSAMLAPYFGAVGVPGYAAGGLVGDVKGMVPWASAAEAQFGKSTMTAWAEAAAKSAISAAVGALAGAGGGYPPGPTGGAQYALEQYAASLFPGHGWSGGQILPLGALWTRESGWNRLARNASSGAYGIAQALPPTKYPFAGQAAGGSSAAAQIAWGEDYIAGRYGTPAGAWAHEMAYNWYGNGGEITEPVWGIGASGQRYRFGEKGRETVIPGGGIGDLHSALLDIADAVDNVAAHVKHLTGVTAAAPARTGAALGQTLSGVAHSASLSSLY
jgi:hypothetical protein